MNTRLEDLAEEVREVSQRVDKIADELEDLTNVLEEVADEIEVDEYIDEEPVEPTIGVGDIVEITKPTNDNHGYIGRFTTVVRVPTESSYEVEVAYAQEGSAYAGNRVLSNKIRGWSLYTNTFRVVARLVDGVYVSA